MILANHNQKLSGQFIEKYETYINLDRISLSQELSQSIKEKYKDKLNWYWFF